MIITDKTFMDTLETLFGELACERAENVVTELYKDADYSYSVDRRENILHLLMQEQSDVWDLVFELDCLWSDMAVRESKAVYMRGFKDSRDASMFFRFF